ncbi:MCE family protein [Mycolicibacterium diernhoferi]|uniref:Mammalian cell entry protein n=1 Tax=Mycolicibacterium diernhoferi TaxID=1801 RepID=A0A1Q4HG96_9MYCO|nr:MCE family protein [Mycolicibacterium diernhoferi]OJZ66579.1 mammalian cell entry protein [Mycolicibacterium diernhoferi]OPE54435.1 mammalian cell entry protein [Mycolicibacterium diernhoferi]PEG56455.1 mammalian cell entry protein [Mycolicibacterium diernhoferi]QYL24761.1 MCE family protein [Mycolicibacterium diernhoferi]
MRRHPAIRRALTGLAATCTAVALTSCSVGLDELPLPAPSAGQQTYPIGATFTDALNLPAKAKVRLSGADVGEVESMEAHDYTAVVTLRIAADVRIPAGTKAELRSATPLGDVFVALTPPPDLGAGAPMMRPGDTIGLASTTSAASVEEVLSTAALLVNGGAIRNLTKVINGMGEAVGGKGEDLHRFIDESTRLIDSLSQRSVIMKRALTQTGDVAAVLAQRQESINEAIEAAGPALGTLAGNTDHIVDLVAQVNRIMLQLAKFPSVRGEQTRSMMADLNRLSAGMNAASVAPGASLARFNTLFGPVLKLTNSTSAHVDIDLADLAVGAFADPYHPADPGSRAPTREDFRNMVGSITYELIKVRDKFWGAPTPPPGNVPPPNLIGPAPHALTPAPPPPGLPGRSGGTP